MDEKPVAVASRDDIAAALEEPFAPEQDIDLTPEHDLENLEQRVQALELWAHNVCALIERLTGARVQRPGS